MSFIATWQRATVCSQMILSSRYSFTSLQSFLRRPSPLLPNHFLSAILDFRLWTESTCDRRRSSLPFKERCVPVTKQPHTVLTHTLTHTYTCCDSHTQISQNPVQVDSARSTQR
eukprot:m.236668 g.236668  ORF g.236668 m.236668 type:complete len:114 (-) comp13923_c1_seq16:1101-1442(-)